MSIDFLRSVFQEHASAEFLVQDSRPITYQWLLDRLDHWADVLADQNVKPGSVVVLEADYTKESIALFLALVERACILVPLSGAVEKQKPELIRCADAQWQFCLSPAGELTFRPLEGAGRHDHYETLQQRGHPGLVVFSSGSTGESKGAVHDFLPILEKFRVRRSARRVIPFLLFDHLGGINNLLYSLSN